MHKGLRWEKWLARYKASLGARNGTRTSNPANFSSLQSPKIGFRSYTISSMARDKVIASRRRFIFQSRRSQIIALGPRVIPSATVVTLTTAITVTFHLAPRSQKFPASEAFMNSQQLSKRAEITEQHQWWRALSLKCTNLNWLDRA